MAKTKVDPAQELAFVADLWFKRRLERLALQKQVEELKEQEDKLHLELKERMETLQLSAIGGKLVKVTLKTTYEPTTESWPHLYQHIQHTGDFDLLYRRINPAAIKARWEQGENVPGIQKFPVTKLSASGVK